MKTKLAILLTLATLATGCLQTIRDLVGRIPLPERPGREPETPGDPSLPSPLVWLDGDISGWPVTATLNAHISGRVLKLENDKATVWPRGFDARGGGDVNGTAWIFIQDGGTWYAMTWEHLRTGQHEKLTAWVKGADGHIQHRKFDTWLPVSGETYGFMVSTIARGPIRTVNERSNVSMVRWP